LEGVDAQLVARIVATAMTKILADRKGNWRTMVGDDAKLALLSGSTPFVFP
jgi:hypothetical protein